MLGRIKVNDNILSTLMHIFSTSFCVVSVMSTAQNTQEMFFFIFSFTDSRTSRPMIPRDTDNSTDPDVDGEKSPHHASDVQPTNCSNVNKQLSTQDDVMMNVHENTAYTNEDHNSVLCDKELCEGTIKSFSCTRCAMSFTAMEEFTSHCATHKTAVEHQCNMCGKSYTRKGDLTAHVYEYTVGNDHSNAMFVIKHLLMRSI